VTPTRGVKSRGKARVEELMAMGIARAVLEKEAMRSVENFILEVRTEKKGMQSRPALRSCDAG
jgi:hypothetical protein